MPGTDLLTDKAIQAALKAAGASGREQRIADGGGLRLDAQPINKVGWWRFRYRFGGRERMLSLGTYPDVPLAAARRARDQARQLVAAGIDPSAKRREEHGSKAAQARAAKLVANGVPAPGSFEAIAREWLQNVHSAKVSEGHFQRTQTRLEQDAFPWIGTRPIDAIDPPELLACLRKIEARGAIETAHRVKDACGQVFKYGIAIGACRLNPASELGAALRPVASRSHAAIIDPKRGGELLRDMGAYQGHPVTRIALGLSALLLLRPGELRHMEWAWVDLATATVTVPATAMKRKKAGKLAGPPHIVPLAPQAVALFTELKALTGHGKYVFPALTTRERCMSENTVRGALRRMGYSNDEMTAHGFRAMARTMIAERLGVEAEVIEAQLGHAVSDTLGRAYNRTQFVDQRRAMMCRWADYLDHLRATI